MHGGHDGIHENVFSDYRSAAQQHSNDYNEFSEAIHDAKLIEAFFTRINRNDEYKLFRDAIRQKNLMHVKYLLNRLTNKKSESEIVMNEDLIDIPVFEPWYSIDKYSSDQSPIVTKDMLPHIKLKIFEMKETAFEKKDKKDFHILDWLYRKYMFSL